MPYALRPTLEGWRTAARPLLAARTPASQVQWESTEAAQHGLDRTTVLMPRRPVPRFESQPRSSRWRDRSPCTAIRRAGPTCMRWRFGWCPRAAPAGHPVARCPATAADGAAGAPRHPKMHAFVRFRSVPSTASSASSPGTARTTSSSARGAVLREALPGCVVDPHAGRLRALGRRGLQFTPGLPRRRISRMRRKMRGARTSSAIFNPARLNLRAMRRDAGAALGRHFPRQCNGETSLINRAHVLKVALPTQMIEAQLDAGYDVATRRHVKILLTTGEIDHRSRRRVPSSGPRSPERLRADRRAVSLRRACRPHVAGQFRAHRGADRGRPIVSAVEGMLKMMTESVGQGPAPRRSAVPRR